MMTVGIKKKQKKHPPAKTSVDIYPDCHIFSLEQQNTKKKIWGTRQQPQSTTNEMADW